MEGVHHRSFKISALTQGTSGSYEQTAHDAVVDVGRTLVAPVAGASRAAALIERATESNIVRRTEVLRNRPPKTVRPLDSKLEGKDALMNENIWADVRYNDVDIDTNDYCGKSNVAIANYQLGYDQKLSSTDYIGAFILGKVLGNISGGSQGLQYHGARRFSICAA